MQSGHACWIGLAYIHWPASSCFRRSVQLDVNDLQDLRCSSLSNVFWIIELHKSWYTGLQSSQNISACQVTDKACKQKMLKETFCSVLYLFVWGKVRCSRRQWRKMTHIFRDHTKRRKSSAKKINGTGPLLAPKSFPSMWSLRRCWTCVRYEGRSRLWPRELLDFFFHNEHTQNFPTGFWAQNVALTFTSGFDLESWNTFERSTKLPSDKAALMHHGAQNTQLLCCWCCDTDASSDVADVGKSRNYLSHV